MASHGRFAGEEAGVIQAIEAVLAAILILGALVFFALVQRPVPPESDTGWDQEQIASDALAILQGGSNTLQSGVKALMEHKTAASKTLTDAIPNLLPTGTRWLLSFDNGFGQTALASSETGVFSQPRGALGAEAYIVLSGWTVTSMTGIQPGSTVTTTGCTTLASPPGNPTAPDGASWFSKLNAGATTGTVPAYFPYGTWTLGGGCTGSFNVIMGSTTAAVPLYGVHLVVWALG